MNPLPPSQETSAEQALEPPVSRPADASVAAGSGDDFLELRLYVSGNTSRSTRAIKNLRNLCDSHLPGAYSLEVIDIYQNPGAAREAQIIAVPTLMKLKPLPVRLLIGDLSDTATLRSALGIG